MDVVIIANLFLKGAIKTVHARSPIPRYTREPERTLFISLKRKNITPYFLFLSQRVHGLGS